MPRAKIGPVDKASKALQALKKDRGDRPVLPLALAFKSRYVSCKLLFLDIQLFVHLIYRLKQQTFAAFLAAPQVARDLSVTQDALDDFNHWWLSIYRTVKEETPVWAALFLAECSKQQMNDLIETLPQDKRKTLTPAFEAKDLRMFPESGKSEEPRPKKRLRQSSKSSVDDEITTLPAQQPSLLGFGHTNDDARVLDLADVTLFSTPSNFDDPSVAGAGFIAPAQLDRTIFSNEERSPVNDEDIADRIDTIGNRDGSCDVNRNSN
ncbi:hypothetical protein ACJZ2D_014352 [Fusarium nematophilum]